MKAGNSKWPSHEGRLSQQAYVLTFTLPFLATLALTASMFTAPEQFAALGQFGIYGVALGWMALMALGDAQNIRRYHDLGNSGRLYRLCRPGIVVLPLLAFLLDFLIPAQLASAGDLDATLHLMGQAMAPTIDPVPMALLGLTVAGVAINVGYLSLMPGQPGPNAHGPSPRGEVALAGVSFAPDNADDLVNRALADYHARQQPAVAAPAAKRQVQPTPTAPAGSFGKKRR
jgi:uncharacterized membrane protein YhaH (DUF805 family)